METKLAPSRGFRTEPQNRGLLSFICEVTALRSCVAAVGPLGALREIACILTPIYLMQRCTRLRGAEVPF